MSSTNKRQIELDLLRVLAMFAVVMTHVCGMETHNLPVTDKNWQMLTFIAACMTWDVPAFVMISGRFFLDPERNVTLKKIWTKSIWRLVLAFAVWSAIYQTYYVLSGTYSLNWKGVLTQLIAGPNHFWYLHMLIWLYAIAPFLRKITESKKLMEYFILLSFLFMFATKYATELPFIGGTVAEVLGSTNMHFVLGYSGYFVLGYYLYKYEIPDKFEIPLYILGILLIVFAAFGTTWASVIEGENHDRFSQYLLPNIMLESAAVYTFFIKRVKKHSFSDKAVKTVSVAAECSFGIYLVHLLANSLVAALGLSPIMANPFIMVPVLAVMVFAISFVAVWLIRKIPRIGKRIT